MSREWPISELERMVNIKRTRKDPPDTREGLLLLARLAAVGNRYEHMFQYMRRLVGIVAPGKALTIVERQCFCSACTFLLQGQLNSFRYVTKAMIDSAVVNKRRAEAAIDYLKMLALEICKTVSDVIGIIDLCFLRSSHPPATATTPATSTTPATAMTPESRVFYKKMKGDFLKYLTEVKKGAGRESVVMDTFRAYNSASNDVEILPATHPTRLELKLSLAIFYSEIRVWPSIAHSVASEAYDLAMQAIATTGQIATEETTEVLKRLRSFMNTLKK